MNRIIDCVVNYFSFNEDARGVPCRYVCYHIVAGPGPTPGSGVATISPRAAHPEAQPGECFQAFHLTRTDGPRAAVARAIAYLDAVHQGEHLQRVQSDLRRAAVDAGHALGVDPLDLKITAADAAALVREGQPVTFLDVRSEKAWKDSAEKAVGATRVSVWEFPEKPVWPLDRLTVVYCTCPTDASSVLAVRDLREMGYHRAYALDGGFSAWQAAGGPVEAKELASREHE
jgi:rhodanese-related sulfurtransferase